MQRKKLYLLMMICGVFLLIITGIWLASAQPVSAQCGSSASSCKNCHEVQAQDPVNNDGTAWHTSHAFGDFCQLCHAGNQQATDIDEAHTGMVPPLQDVSYSCGQCHVADLDARAQVYATTLGISYGTGGGDAGTTTTTTETTTTTTTTTEPSAGAPATTELNFDDPNLVDYAARYDEIVLGKKPVNWGNVILIAMAVMLLFGGGAFVLKNEKLVKVGFGDTRPVSNEYPADIVDMLPALTKLKPQQRKSMRAMLENPKKTARMLALLDEFFSDKKEE